ncbi:AAA family ATPase [Pseudactinotalea sp. HY160]|nr:AAA family ATPase [Pseudactinotalea sp. HY160]
MDSLSSARALPLQAGDVRSRNRACLGTMLVIVASAPQVIIMTGPPGSGKSTTALELASRLRATLLDQDSMTNPLVDVVASLIGAAGLDDPRLAALVREPRYECVHRVVQDCLHAGISTVVVAPFTAERRDPRAWAELARRIEAHGGTAHLVWLRISAGELVRRLRSRSAARDRAKLADLEGYVASLDLTAPAVPFIEVDSHEAATLQVAAIQTRLEHDQVTVRTQG